MKKAGIVNFLNKILSFCYVFNVFEILSVSKKYLDLANSKWWIKCTRIQKYFIKVVFISRKHRNVIFPTLTTRKSTILEGFFLFN